MSHRSKRDEVDDSGAVETPKPDHGRELAESGHGHFGRIVMLVCFLGLFGVLFTLYRDRLSLDYLAAREDAFRSFQNRQPLIVYGVAFFAYVIVTGLSLPGAAGMTLLLGWLFGFWRALIVVSFASTTGAAVAFLLSRHLLWDLIQERFHDRLAKFNEALEREGAFYLFTLRLIPAVPFFVINLVMGLTPMPLRTYWWVSQIGMLPGTAAYVYAGASVPSLEILAERGLSGILSPQLLAAFAILGLFPIIVKKIYEFAAGKASHGISKGAPDSNRMD